MSWVVFMYSLGASQSSSPRVTVWRRLQRLGAISPRAGVHVLPDISECQESLHWLAREVQQLNGESLVMKVAEFDGLSDQELTDLFRDQSRALYKDIEEQIINLQQRLSKVAADQKLAMRTELQKLRRKQSEISETDFFEVSEGKRVGALIADVERQLTPTESVASKVQAVSISEFQKKLWVTRPRPHVDRLACAWFIRKFIDPTATIRYKDNPDKSDIAFDMKQGGRFGHIGNLCTFEVMVNAFRIDEPAVKELSQIIHELDVKDGAYWHPESAGIEAILSGWRLSEMTDEELESHGIALFEALFQIFKSKRITENQSHPSGNKKATSRTKSGTKKRLG
jgi:hypothetical protein